MGSFLHMGGGHEISRHQPHAERIVAQSVPGSEEKQMVALVMFLASTMLCAFLTKTAESDFVDEQQLEAQQMDRAVFKIL